MNLDKKTWAVLYALPVLFFVLIGINSKVKIPRVHVEPQKTHIDEDKLPDPWADNDVVFNYNTVRKGDDMALADAYLVTGLTPPEDGGNGIYVRDGDFNGFPYFENPNGFSFKRYDDSWFLFPPTGEELYVTTDYITSPEEGPDFSGYSGVAGSTPYPTVTAFVPVTFEIDDAEITSDGNLKITWDIDNPPAAGSTGMTLSGGHALGDWQHNSNTSTAKVTPPVLENETGLKLSYDDSTGDFEDDEENALESFTDEPVTNNSTQKKKFKPIVWNSETSRMRRLREDERLDTVFDVAHQLPRVQTVGSAAQITPDAGAYDRIYITAQAAALEFKNPTGGSDGQTLLIRIKDNGTSRNLTWGAAYRGVMGNTLPSATDASATAYIGFVFNDADGKWDLVAV